MRLLQHLLDARGEVHAHRTAERERRDRSLGERAAVEEQIAVVVVLRQTFEIEDDDNVGESGDAVGAVVAADELQGMMRSDTALARGRVCHHVYELTYRVADLSSSAFSSAVRASSTTRSMPPVPRMTGTPM